MPTLSASNAEAGGAPPPPSPPPAAAADDSAMEAMMAEAVAGVGVGGDDLNEFAQDVTNELAGGDTAAPPPPVAEADVAEAMYDTEPAPVPGQLLVGEEAMAVDADPPLDLPPLPTTTTQAVTTMEGDIDDVPLASLKVKTNTITIKRRYYAVRVGYAACPACSESKEEGCDNNKGGSSSHVSVIRSAIFLRWEDVKDFVEFTTAKLIVNGEEAGQVSTAVGVAAAAATSDENKANTPAEGTSAEDAAPTNTNEGVIRLPFHHNVEYKAFDEIERAERYLKRVIPEFKNDGTSKGYTSSKSLKKNKKLKAAKAGKTKIKSLNRKAPLPDFPPPKNFNPPTKKWETMYAVAIEYKTAHGDLDVPTDETGEHEELAKWIKYQRNSYRYYLEDPMGGRHSMTEEKVNRLKEAGFTWIVTDKKKWLAEEPASTPTGKRKRGRPRKTAAMRLAEMEASPESKPGARGESKNRPIRPKWLGMLNQLKEYRAQHGTIEISSEETDEELSELRQWCKNQKNMHIRWRQGHDVGMTLEKADMLKEVGMEFPPAWEDMYVKIVQYKAQNNGSIEITADYDPILAAWMSRQNEVLGRHLQGKSTRLTDDQAMRLLALGFQGGRGAVAGSAISVTGKSVASRDFDARWDEMLLRLKDYKTENGTCNVPTSCGTELAHWVAAQRRMYNKLVAGKPGKRAVLDAVKMQRLTELGFQFRPRGSYTAWDDQMKALWKFREENGHCRVPVNHQELGSFVKLARRDYKNWTQGKATSMTPEREAALKEVGFIFEGGKTPQRAPVPIKRWEERLEELLQYKAEFGHTVVPQNSGQLGAWVHSQRVHYKKFKDGQKSQMTAEKALKLTEIGFCFNASDRYRGNKRHRSHEQEEEEVDPTQHAMMQQHQYPQAQQVQPQHYHHHHQMQDTVHVPGVPPLQPYI